MSNLPFARHQDVVVQDLDKEILIYDLLTHKAYHLNETSSLVYRACDGKTAFGELKAKTKFTDEIIFLALDELKKENLIEVNDSYASPFAGMTRRQVIRKVGLASMVVLPAISFLTAPTAAMAASACAGTLPQNALRGACSAAVGQPPATLASCTATCQSVFASGCASCSTYATPQGSPNVFLCYCS
jgi:hypothetical protein